MPASSQLITVSNFRNKGISTRSNDYGLHSPSKVFCWNWDKECGEGSGGLLPSRFLIGLDENVHAMCTQKVKGLRDFVVTP